MENVRNQFENLKSRVFYGDRDSTWPTAVKFGLTPETEKIIDTFDKEMSLSNRSIGTRMNYFKCLRNFFFYLACEKGIKTLDLDKITKEDLIDFFHSISNRGMKPGTVNVHKHVVKKLYKFMNGDEEYPKLVKWIKFERKPKPQLPKNLITEEQIKTLIIFAKNARDKAIIASLAECGGRVSELLNVNLDDLEWLFDEQTMTPIVRMRLVDIKGHTGERRVELFDSVPYLQAWLNEHPYRDNPEAPLFVCSGNKNFGRRMGRHMVWTIIYAVGKRAGLENVTLNPHSFRHRSLTEKGKFMSKFELAKFAGHTMSSRMVDVYIHLEDRDINNKLRQIRGLAPIESVKQLKSALTIKRCVCGEVNPTTAIFCNRCRKPLDEKFVEISKKDLETTLEKEAFAKEFMNFIMENPKASEFMENMMRMFVERKQTANEKIL